MAETEPGAPGACGEPVPSDELRDALSLLREGTTNAEFRALVDDVLAGRCSLIDASGTAAFAEVVFAPVARELSERFSTRTETEKQAIARNVPPAPTGSTATGSLCGDCVGSCALACAAESDHPTGSARSGYGAGFPDTACGH